MIYSRMSLVATLVGVCACLCLQAARTAEVRIVDKTGRIAAGTRFLHGVLPAAAIKIKRYDKTEMAAWTEYKLPPDCSEVSAGAWTVDKKPKYGVISTGTTTGHLANGDCPSNTYTFATIYYKWDTHNNKSYTDAFDATWKAPDFTEPQKFSVRVDPVRPVGETTQFIGWADTRGQWQQTLIPPKEDPDFDFTGERIKEVFQGQSDNCGPGFPFPSTAQPKEFPPVRNKVTWGPDGVGWGNNDNTAGHCAIEYFRCHRRTPCGFTIQQQMTISSPADKGKFFNYGSVNTLRANIEGQVVPLLANKTGVGNITSERAGQSAPPQLYPSSALSCQPYPQVDLNGC